MSLLYFFVFQCFVKNTVGVSKLSLLFLYLDVFPQQKFRILCWALIIHISLTLIALNIVTILQCQPIQFSWDKSLDGKWYVVGKSLLHIVYTDATLTFSINIKAFWYAQSGWNTLMDVIVLVMPIPLVVKLQMNLRGKLGLFAVFLLGTL